MKGSYIGEVQHLAIVVVKKDVDPFQQENLVIFSVSIWIKHFVYLCAFAFVSLKQVEKRYLWLLMSASF